MLWEQGHTASAYTDQGPPINPSTCINAAFCGKKPKAILLNLLPGSKSLLAAFVWLRVSLLDKFTNRVDFAFLLCLLGCLPPGSCV